MWPGTLKGSSVTPKPRSVIEPGFDAGGAVVDFLVNFTAGLNGLLFVWDSILDYDGPVLLGPLLHPEAVAGVAGDDEVDAGRDERGKPW